jgi:hypothetical protein
MPNAQNAPPAQIAEVSINAALLGESLPRPVTKINMPRAKIKNSGAARRV